MDVVVLLKQVPDSSEPRSFGRDNTLDRDSSQRVINELDEYALEAACQLRDEHGGTITTLTMGPQDAKDAIRRALAFGADQGVLVTDEHLHGSCAVTTARILAAALRQLPHDLILTGWEATDGQMGVIAPMCAELLSLPQLTGAQKLSVDENTLTIERVEPGAYTVVTSQLPAVVSVTDTINEPHYPSFRALMWSIKKPITTLSLADLDVEAAEITPTTRVLDVEKRATQREKRRLDASETVGEEIAEFLTSRGVL